MSKVTASKRSILDELFLKCGECNERFWDNSKLIKHMESHDETKPLLCTICNKTFDSIQDLDKHYLLHRQLMQPYGCPACESRFVTQQQLMAHVDNIHPELAIGGKLDSDSNVESAGSSSNSKRSTPKTNDSKIKIMNVESITRKSHYNLGSQQEVACCSKKKSPIKVTGKLGIGRRLSHSMTKKSILKTAPTPAGKKRPVVWKDPVVSPERDLRSKVISVQYKKLVGDKRKLTTFHHQDATGTKKLKIVPSQTSREDSTQIPVGSSTAPSSDGTSVDKIFTPVRKTPITKTKLMQSISDLYDNQTLNEKKSLAQTRKDLLNGLQIPSKGPIRVSKVVKQPFIVYNPNKEKDSNDLGDQSSKGIAVSKSPSSVQLKGLFCNEGNQKVSVASPNVDAKPLSATNLSTCVIKVSDKKKVPQTFTFDDLMKKNALQSNVNLASPAIQLTPVPRLETVHQSTKKQISIQATPVRTTIQRDGLTISRKEKLEKNKKLSTVDSLPEKPSSKTINPISTTNQFPRELNVINLTSTNVQSSLKNKIVPSNSSTKPSLRLTRNRKLASAGNSSTKEDGKSESIGQCISETEVLPNHGVQCKKLEILFPSITLERLSVVDINANCAKRQAKLQTVNKSSMEEQSMMPKVSSVEEQDLASGVKQRQALQSVMAKGVEEQANLKSAEVGNVKIQDKLQTLEADSFKDQVTLECEEGRHTKRRGKLQSSEENSIEEQIKLKSTEAGVVKRRGNLKSAEACSVKPLSPNASSFIGQAQLQSIEEKPKQATRNITRSRSKQLKEESVDNVVKESNQTLKCQSAEVAESNIAKEKITRSKPQIVDSATITNRVPTTRRTKRLLPNKTANNKDSLIGVKNRKGALRGRKIVSKKKKMMKDILEKVIEKEFEAMEGGEKENNINKVVVDSNVRKTVNPPVLPPASLMTPIPTNIRIVTLTPEVMKKLRETVLKKTSGSPPNHLRLVVPSEVLCKIQNSTAQNQNAGTPNTSVAKPQNDSSPKVNTKSPTAKIIKYGLEDLKRDQQRIKEEKARMEEKEKILKKMLAKYDEKEKKKQLKFCEKKLSRFIGKHRASHLEKLEEQLLNIRNLSFESGAQVLEDVKRLGCIECKEVIGSTLCSLGFGDIKDLHVKDKALQGFIALSTSKVKKNNKKAKVAGSPKSPVISGQKQKRPYTKKSQVATKIQPSPKKLAKVSPKKESSPGKTSFRMIECVPNKGYLSYSNKGYVSYSNKGVKKCKVIKRKVLPERTRTRRNVQRKPKEINNFLEDPFADVSIVTEDKFVLECPCMKPNCVGLHPENFLI